MRIDAVKLAGVVYRNNRIMPLCIIGIGGLLGVLLDTDHLIAGWLGWGNVYAYRFLHPPLFILSAVVCGYYYSRIRRLLNSGILKNEKTNNQT